MRSGGGARVRGGTGVRNVLVAGPGSRVVLRHGAGIPSGRGRAVVMRARMGSEGGSQGRLDEEERGQKCHRPFDFSRHAPSRWFGFR